MTFTAHFKQISEYPDDSVITSAAVQNVKFNYQPGDAPRATAAVAAADQGKYRISDEWWQELNENDEPVAIWHSNDGIYSTLPTITAFESGKKYVYSVLLLPERGYDFGREVAATVNGSTVTAVPGTDGYLSLPNVKTITPTAASHTHSYGTAWKYDDTNHWHECECGDKADIAAHSASEWIVDTAATETADGAKHKECTVCKKVLETATIPATGSSHTNSYGVYVGMTYTAGNLIYQITSIDTATVGQSKVIGVVAAKKNKIKKVTIPDRADCKGLTVQFVVDKDGSIKEPKLLRSVDKDMDAEALRLISNMPKWKPGRQKGQPVAVKYTVPVMFSLDDDKLEKTSSANGITVEGYAGNGKEPLYIVDGKEVTPSVMSALDPNKIERVTVLKDKSATELYGEKGKNGVLLITLKQGTPGIVIRRDKEVTENAKVQHNGSLDLTKTIYIDGEKVDLGTKTIDDLIPAENIESIEVKKEAGGKGEIYIATKKTKAVEKTSVQGNMKVEGKVVDEQGEPIIGAAVLIEGTTTGSVTDVNGNFVLSVPSKDAVLVASYIGMATGKVKARPKLTITLKNE